MKESLIGPRNKKLSEAVADYLDLSPRNPVQANGEVFADAIIADLENLSSSEASGTEQI